MAEQLERLSLGDNKSQGGRDRTVLAQAASPSSLGAVKDASTQRNSIYGSKLGSRFQHKIFLLGV